MVETITLVVIFNHLPFLIFLRFFLVGGFIPFFHQFSPSNEGIAIKHQPTCRCKMCKYAIYHTWMVRTPTIFIIEAGNSSSKSQSPITSVIVTCNYVECPIKSAKKRVGGFIPLGFFGPSDTNLPVNSLCRGRHVALSRHPTGMASKTSDRRSSRHRSGTAVSKDSWKNHGYGDGVVVPRCGLLILWWWWLLLVVIGWLVCWFFVRLVGWFWLLLVVIGWLVCWFFVRSVGWWEKFG